MNDVLKELLAAEVLPTTSFPPTSRYAEVAVTTHDDGSGAAPIPHLARRLCPNPERFADIGVVSTIGTDRADVLADRHLGDSALWWRLADANAVLDPRDLTAVVGTRLRLTLAVDIPGIPDE